MVFFNWLSLALAKRKMRQILLIFVILFFGNIGISQSRTFKATLSNETIHENNFAILRFTIINQEGEFIEPDFNDFEVLESPKISKYTSYINGEKIIETNYTYYIKPVKTGYLKVGSAYLRTNNQISHKTDEKKLHVLPKLKDLVTEAKKNSQMLKFSISRNN
jgi:hypothetical protein